MMNTNENEIMFSVAIITYNQEKYISQTLESILNQEHNYNYEIIIGEDCSSDNTKKIIEKYASKYPNIIKPIFNNPNMGLLKNYFNVIENCNGKYIMECAGDDYWLPGKVKSQIELLEKDNSISLTYSKAKFWDENNKKFKKDLFGEDVISFENLLINGNKIPALTVCFKNDDIKEYIKEIQPLDKPWLMEDFPIWLWFYKNRNITFINQVLGCYRVLEDSACHCKDIEKKFNFEKSYLNIKYFFSELYNFPITTVDENRIYYNLCFKYYKKTYDITYLDKLKKTYNSLKNKTIKDGIKYYLSYFPRILKFLLKFKLLFIK